MTTRLEQLIYSLTSVLVRYHDSQVPVKDRLVEAEPELVKQKSNEFARSILQDTKTDYFEFLEKKNSICTNSSTRKEFLSFILKEIHFLKEQLNRKTPYTVKEFELFNEQLSQLLIDMNQLLNIKKKAKYTVTLSKSAESVPMFGLLNDRYVVGGKYCTSGQILVEEVPFLLQSGNVNNELIKISAQIGDEFQNLLQKQSKQEEQIKKLRDLHKEQEVSTTKLLAKSKEQDASISELLEKIKDKEFDLTDLLEQKKELEFTISELEDKNKSQEQIIYELRAELEQSKTQIQDLKKSKAHPTPAYGFAQHLATPKDPRFFTNPQKRYIPMVDDVDDEVPSSYWG